jgi:hypothetical protein
MWISFVSAMQSVIAFAPLHSYKSKGSGVEQSDDSIGQYLGIGFRDTSMPSSVNK